MKKLLALFCLYSVAGAASLLGAATETVVRFHTSLGDIDVQLFPDTTPKTVANFLSYVDQGSYANGFIHRSVPGFIIQGGGYYVDSSRNIQYVATQPPVVNEYRLSNLRGTIAMAKLGNDPNSATSQWFFNLADNSANLNNQNGGFTVFGQIINDQGLAVMDAIAALPVYDVSDTFNQLPVINYTSGNVTVDNLVYVTSITRQPAPMFFAGEVSLGSDNYYLKFPATGTAFGYYKYLTAQNFIYHYDLGFEYVFDAADGDGGVVFYDFKSKDYFYTSPTFPFPYLYDFSLRAFLYYYPDPNDPDHYNTDGTRYFYNYSTGQVISR